MQKVDLPFLTWVKVVRRQSFHLLRVTSNKLIQRQCAFQAVPYRQRCSDPPISVAAACRDAAQVHTFGACNETMVLLVRQLMCSSNAART